ncbi:MAG: prepilin peptidase, partial [Armatimonadota bacterium]|nr:prepilin peptidase [Armatimonadota bacterium]
MDRLTSGPIALLVSGAVGLILGSFNNVLIHRLPRGESVVWPGSR